MITISLLDKGEKDLWLPRMFDLLFGNMKNMAPSGLPYEQEREVFLAQVSLALDKQPRQVLLAVEDGALVGDVQYYTRDELLMVEEFQIRQDHQRTLLFLWLCRALLCRLPREIRTVEAYADPRNHGSRHLMEKLDMTELPEEGPYVHLRGNADALRSKICKLWAS